MPEVYTGSEGLNSPCAEACSAFENKVPIPLGFEEVTQQETAGEGKLG